MKKCPYCAEEIQDQAIVCKHCGRDIPESPRPSEAKGPEHASTLSAARVDDVSAAAPTSSTGGALGRVAAGGDEAKMPVPQLPSPSKRRWITAAVLVLLLVGIGGAVVATQVVGKNDTSIASPGADTQQASPCIDSVELLKHRDLVQKHLREVVRSGKELDLANVETEARLAASETRAMADTVGDTAPTIEENFLRAADALDKAATSFGNFDPSGASSWIRQGTNEVRQGVATITQEMYC